MLDTPAIPAGEREEETGHDRIFTEFMAGYRLAPPCIIPLYPRAPLLLSPLLPGRKFSPGGRSSARSTRDAWFYERSVARFEELVDGGERFLARFRRKLEYFRRPRLPSESDVMGEIVRSNCTDRMKSYLESGGGLHCQNISNLSQLHSCEGELKGYINKVNALLKELQSLVEDAYDATLTANLSAIKLPDENAADSKVNDQSHSREEKEEQPSDQLDHDSSLVTLMILVHNMLKLDYTMQEKIVRSLSLKSSSAELESYCLMWDLRPYVDSDVMHLAWKMCP